MITSPPAPPPTPAGSVPPGFTPRHDVSGDILSTNAEGIRRQLVQVLADDPASPIETFELNLRGTRMIDSVGLNLLVWLIKQVRARGGKLRISLADANVLRTFQFTRLDREAEVVRVAVPN